MKKISPTYAIFFNLIGLIVFIICDLVRFDQPSDPDVVLWVPIFSILAYIPAIIAAAMLHYKCWEAIPPDIARTTPGMAVGLLFVPFFNFYWYFVSYAGLAEDCAKALESRGSSRGLGIALGIVVITGCTPLVLIPLMVIPLGVVSFIIWLIYTLRIVADANTLVSRESQPTGKSVEQSPLTAGE